MVAPEIIKEFENLVYRSSEREDDRDVVRSLWGRIVARKLQSQVRADVKLVYQMFYVGKQ